MSEQICIVLLGSNSVIGNAVTSALQDFHKCPVLRVGRVKEFRNDALRIHVTETDDSGKLTIHDLESYEALKHYLRQGEIVVKALVISIGYMSKPDSQLNYTELIRTFDANVAYPINGVIELTDYLGPSSYLIFLSSSLNGFPLQGKHFNYQLSKEYSDRLLSEHLEIAKSQFHTFLVRPGHVATKLNNHVPTRFSSIEPESIGRLVLKKVQRHPRGRKRIQNIYVPNSLRAVVMLSKFLPRFFLKQLFRYL